MATSRDEAQAIALELALLDLESRGVPVDDAVKIKLIQAIQNLSAAGQKNPERLAVYAAHKINAGSEE